MEKSSLKFKEDVTVITEGNTKEVKAGEVLEVPQGKTVLAKGKGKSSILIVPVSEKNELVELSLPNLESKELDNLMAKNINDEVSNIMTNVNMIQKLVFQKKYQLALTKVNEAKVTHPEIAYIRFLESSIYMMMDNKFEAVRAVRKGLDLQPDSVEGRQLLDNLQGGSL